MSPFVCLWFGYYPATIAHVDASRVFTACHNRLVKSAYALSTSCYTHTHHTLELSHFLHYRDNHQAPDIGKQCLLIDVTDQALFVHRTGQSIWQTEICHMDVGHSCRTVKDPAKVACMQKRSNDACHSQLDLRQLVGRLRKEHSRPSALLQVRLALHSRNAIHCIALRPCHLLLCFLPYSTPRLHPWLAQDC